MYAIVKRWLSKNCRGLLPAKRSIKFKRKKDDAVSLSNYYAPFFYTDTTADVKPFDPVTNIGNSTHNTREQSFTGFKGGDGWGSGPTGSWDSYSGNNSSNDSSSYDSGSSYDSPSGSGAGSRYSSDS